MDELAAARALLPTWVRLFPWLLGPAMGLLGYLTTGLAMRLSLRPLPEGPWTERARLVHPARVAGQVSRVLHLTFGVMVGLGWGGSWAAWPPAVPALLVLVCAYGGPVLASLRFEARIRSLRLGELVRSWASVTLVANGGPAALALCVPLSRVEGPAGLALALSGTALVVWLGTGGGLPLARAVGLARPASERVTSAVRRASERTGVQVNGVFEIDWALANAVAFPFLRRVGFTRAAVAALDDAQLEAVAAHELGHLAERLRTRLVRPALLTLLCLVTLVLPRFFSPGPLAALGVLLLVLGVLWVAGRLVRGSEREADATAKDSDGHYAKALERLYQLNLTPAVLRRQGSHGHLYDRLTAAGGAPAWQRPDPPPRPPFVARLVAVALPTGLLLVGAAVREGAPADTFQAEEQIAFGGHRPWAPQQLALDAAHAGRKEDALVFQRAAVRLGPSEPIALAQLVVMLVATHQCDEAWKVLEQAQARALAGRRAVSDAEVLAHAAEVASSGCRAHQGGAPPRN